MAPVIHGLRQAGLDTLVLGTAQHRELLDQMLGCFGITLDFDLDAMRPDQTPSDLVGLVVPALSRIIAETRPALVMAQGDTVTVLGAALAAFFSRRPFAHVEAGLRSGDLRAPFPEEGIRRLAATVTALHFAPTDGARQALLREGQPAGSVHVVGNTVIDALLEMARRPDLPWPQGLPLPGPEERLILVTLHRRENFGAPLDRILRALRDLCQRFPQVRLLYPVHPNPSVRAPARAILGGVPGVHLCDPLDYPSLVSVLGRCHAVFTDSGGLQEEAPALGRPVLVFRDVTERPEAVAAGGVRLVGSDTDRFLREAARLLEDDGHYRAMAVPRFPYGDGRASQRIARIVAEHLGAAAG